MEDKNTYIKTLSIALHLECVYETKEEVKKYTNEVYEYLRDAMFAQNRAYNICLDRTKEAYSLGRSKDRIKEIIYQHSHVAPIDGMEQEFFLKEILVAAPIDTEYVENKVNNRREFYLSKKKPPKQETIDKNCESLRRKYEKFVGVSKKEIQRRIDMLENYCAYPEEVYSKFANGLGTPAYVKQWTEKYWKQAGVKQKVVYGASENLRQVKDDNALFIPSNVFFNKKKELIGLTHGYVIQDEFLYKLETDRNVDVYFNMPYKKKEPALKFKLILGNPLKSRSLRLELSKVFTGEYRIMGSRLAFQKNKETKKKTDLYLKLSVECPIKRGFYLDENIVCGMDIGKVIPIMAALNNDHRKRGAFGSFDRLCGMKAKLSAQRRRAFSQCQYARGGHGRKRKLSRCDIFSEREKNYSDTEMRKIAKKAVEWAVKNHAKYIKLENLKGIKEKNDSRVTKGWSPYKLQTYIEQAAAKYGIIVLKVNPCFTSQVCCECGNWHPLNRPKGDKGQAYFDCHNPECITHSDGWGKQNADFNAARNISMSTLYMEASDEVNKERMKEAMEYYHISYDGIDDVSESI